jgi:uncharacterized protein (TIGR02186 family)
MKTIRLTPYNYLLVSVLSILFGLSVMAGNASANLTIKANHDKISINSFYHGSTVSVSGQYEPGTELIVNITSPEVETVLKEKGKAAGFLWMNTGELHFSDTPNLYILRSTKKIKELLDSAQSDQYVLGLSALKHHVNIEEIPNSEEAGKAEWFGEFVKFKEKIKLYSEETGRISLNEADGKHTYYTLFDWPYQAPPGNYQVAVHAVKDGKLVETAHSEISVEQAGAVKYLSKMAKNNGAMYGIISIVVALLSGFGAGLIFKKGGGAH